MVAGKRDPKASIDCQAEKPGPTMAQNHRKRWERPWVKGNRENVIEGCDQGGEFFGGFAGHAATLQERLGHTVVARQFLFVDRQLRE